MLPRSERQLIEEISVWQPMPPLNHRSISNADLPLAWDSAKNKKTTRRMSGTIAGESKSGKNEKEPSLGSKRDLWLIYMTDVVIRCRRIGFTTRAIGTPNLSKAKSKDLTENKRNLYQFIKVERWEMRTLRNNMISMEEVSELRRAESMLVAGDAIDDEDQFHANSGQSRMSYVLCCSRRLCGLISAGLRMLATSRDLPLCLLQPACRWLSALSANLYRIWTHLSLSARSATRAV